MRVRANNASGGGGGDKYDSQDWISVTANASIPVFTTKGRAKAIWISRWMSGYAKAITYTNVNPTTGELDNDNIYSFDSSAAGHALEAIDFQVSDNQITFSARFTSSAHMLQLNYTY